MIKLRNEATPWDKSRLEKRFIITDSETGEIMCDASGHGYRTYKTAVQALSYKLAYDERFKC